MTTGQTGRRFLCALLLNFLCQSGLRAETLTIATYNVENYDATNRMTEQGFRKEYPKPEAQKTALRRVLHGLNADVLVLQEMGTAPYLEELRRDLKAEGLDYPHAMLLEGPDEVRHVAILSRRPFTSVVQHTMLQFPYLGGREKVKRGLLEVRTATAQGELTIFALHLKSRFTDRPDDPQSALRRLGEAVAIRDAVLQEFPDPARARFVIAGDFNDDKASKPLQRILERGKTVIAALVPATDARGETWTHNYRRQDNYTRVDHILVSPGLVNSVRGSAAKIYDGAGVAEASDHRPVVVTLEFGGAK
ncbi:MAG TPA: endonuclease/exonuclease/phosphatase family protein [Opitutus sp.]|nr:endonuclease/exonuclease/phosphatase family protein [Opitutus sp.]